MPSGATRHDQNPQSRHRKGHGAWAPTALLASVLLLSATDASAFFGDTVQLFVAETVTHDDNVFRISKDLDPRTFLGSSSTADTYTTSQFGANLDLTVSRQRFLATTSWGQTHYQRFSRLDFDSHDLQGSWLWQLGDQWNGQLGYIETKTLASLSNVQSGVINPLTVNPLTTQRTFGTANYLITPNWLLEAGLAQTEQHNGDFTRQINDANVSNADLTFNYVSNASNKLGVSLRQENGHMPNRQLIGGTAYDNSYDQHSTGLVTDWSVTAKSNLKARIDWVQRNFKDLTQRNWDGTTTHLTYNWKTTEALTVIAEAQRDIGSLEETHTSLVLIKGLNLRPSLALSEKTRVSALVDYSTRDYLTDPISALGAPVRSDRVHIVGATLSYTPLAKLLIEVAGQHESRTSNIAFGDYKANFVNIKARLAF